MSFSCFFIIFRHFLKEHYEGKIFECDWSECGAVFKKETNLQHHKYIHREQERKCEVKTCKLKKVRNYFHNLFQVCDEIFQRRSSFYIHWKEKHFETHGLRSVWLQSMGKTVERKKSIYPRKRLCLFPALNHLGNYTCDICGITCNSRGSIKTHLKYRHFLKNFLFCELCPKSFNMKFFLKKHMEAHHKLKTEGQETKSLKIKIQRTRIRKPKLIKLITCTDCDMKFKSHQELRE